ncbi:MIP/aquaporin family protein [Hydrogenophaga sp.]|uniref:MIP/aquaporin family protein n=1 Tax=Hydrogenophaga sp. TaxID=1904254 RepID=UPI0019BDD278|nr:MIP/aquaporin family protein [Hydrogenophaga sp.]MBD3892962.1 aquaporin family protein [Hydrogenophaga sp.]
MSGASVAPADDNSLGQKLLAEGLGTCALLCVVIGSGIMAERLADGNVALALLANTLATVFALYVLIETLGPISGAHFNPVVTLALAVSGRLGPQRVALTALGYIACQLAGAVLGAWLAHAMFGLDLLQTSTKLRSGPGLWLAEVVATAALIWVICRSFDGRVQARVSTLVACTIGAAYWFTASTSFANPAAVLGRLLSDSFAGIAPSSAPAFVLAQCVGGALGLLLALQLQARKTAAPRAVPSASLPK